MTNDQDQHAIEAMRKLWSCVLGGVIRDHKARIQAARRNERWVTTDGERRKVMSLEKEIRYARRHFFGNDGRDVMEMAGYGHQPQRIMDHLTGDLGQSFRERDREIVRRFLDGMPADDLAKAFQISRKHVLSIVRAAE